MTDLEVIEEAMRGIANRTYHHTCLAMPSSSLQMTPIRQFGARISTKPSLARRASLTGGITACRSSKNASTH